MGRLLHGTLEERLNCGRNFGRVSFQREMTGIEELNLSIRIIASERLRPGRQEERIILAPDSQERQPLFAEERLKFGIQGDIAGVIEEQVELDIIVTGPGEQRGI